MKRLLRLVLLLAVVGLWVPATSWAAPGDGISGTAHDFFNRGTVTTGVCTYCHTPHKALQTLLLWNHTLSSNSFSWDVPSTTAGTTFPTIVGNTYQGVTAKCLSCHDGSVAIGDIAWFQAQKPATPINATQHGAGDPFNIGLGGSMAGNHPVAMPFPFNNAASTYNGSTTGAAAYLDEWRADPTALGIRLFKQVVATEPPIAGTAPGATGIECSSCHDPHNKKSTGVYFLRGTLTGNTTDYICLKCHVK